MASDKKKYLKLLEKATLFDDIFQKNVINVHCITEILKALDLYHRIHIKKLHKSYEIKPFAHHGVILDHYFEIENGVGAYDIQRLTKDAPPLRIRFYRSMLDVYSSNPGMSYEDLKDILVIFHYKHDPFGLGQPYYICQPYFEGTNVGLNEIIIAINGDYMDLNTKLGQINHDFRQKDPDKMLNKVLKKYTMAAKRTKEGVEKMAGIFEKFKQEVTDEVTKKVTEEVTKDVTTRVTKDVTKKVTEESNYNILNELTSTKYPGSNLSWLKQCTLEQLKLGIRLILSNLSYDEFKTQVLNK